MGVETLKRWIEESNNIVFFGGAGVSTESGIPDFRGEEGIFKTISEYGVSPETILSYSFFEDNQEVFFKYLKKYMLFPEALPNSAHYGLAKLEKQGKLKAVITQNIDNLHQKAGSKNVLELHGNLYRNYCPMCWAEYEFDYIIKDNGVPLCQRCRSVVRPDIVLYEEMLDQKVLDAAVKYIKKADVLIVGGTSLNVFPASGLVNYYKGDKLVLINKGKTAFDGQVNLIINENIGEVFEKIMNGN